jgi:hypothetical protein
MGILNSLPRNFFTGQFNDILPPMGNSEFSQGFKLANVVLLVNETRNGHFQYLLNRCSITAVYFCQFENVELF